MSHIRQTLIYISGKYSGDVAGNIAEARRYAIKLWEKGYAVICPHLNTAHFEEDCNCQYEDYIEADVRILANCDMIFMLPDWQSSKGACIEHEFASQNNIEIIYNPEDL
jgi:hypothetical protein